MQSLRLLLDEYRVQAFESGELVKMRELAELLGQYSHLCFAELISMRFSEVDAGYRMATITHQYMTGGEDDR